MSDIFDLTVLCLCFGLLLIVISYWRRYITDLPLKSLMLGCWWKRNLPRVPLAVLGNGSCALVQSPGDHMLEDIFMLSS